MEMAESIKAFFNHSLDLYALVSAIRDDPTSNNVQDERLSKVVSQFEGLVTRLSSARSGSSSVPVSIDDKPLEGRLDLFKAARKVSQDVLLHLKRSEQMNAHGTPTTVEVSGKLVWTTTDIEALAGRVMEIQSQWNISHAGTPDIVPISSELISRHDTFAVQEPSSAREKKVSASEQDTSGRNPTGILIDFILESLSFKSMKTREEEVAEAYGDTFDWIFKYQSSKEGDAHLGDRFTSWLSGSDLGSIYWVTGKPGSGKSTLMRYIAEHRSTRRHLKTWAGNYHLATAVFYFWTSGSEEQRSQTGLLRYLLHQLLSSDVNLIPKVFPDLWQKLTAMETRARIRFVLEWTIPDLMIGFQRYLGEALSNTKICLFVDGLDEFEGDHRAIVQFFKTLSEGSGSSHIKLCLSSRPWEVFENAFEYSVPNLKLQDLTFQDMTQYVRDNLSKSKPFQGDETEKEAITKKIVQQADGVFLWVRLVVRKLIEHHVKAITFPELQAYVREFPSDLDQLFQKLLFVDQTKDQLVESTHIFELVRAREVVAAFVKDESSNALSLWQIAFALNSHDEYAALNAKVIESNVEETVERCNLMRAQVISRSAGLLEAYDNRTTGNMFESSSSKANQMLQRLASQKVTYVHRTVRDHLMFHAGAWHKLTSYASSSFDPHLRLIRSHVLQLKHSLEPIEHHRRLDEWYPDIALSLTHARYIADSHEAEQCLLIDELEKTISWYWQSRPGDKYDHWARSCFGSYESRKGNKMIILFPFLALCTKFGLEHYVLRTIDSLATSTEVKNYFKEYEHDVKNEPNKIVEQTPLLSYALEFLTSRQKTIMPLSSRSFVASLLRSHHLDHPILGPLIGTPNAIFDSPLTGQREVTPWILVLSHLRDAKRRGWIEPFDINPEGTGRWTDIVRMMLQDGKADRKAFLKWNGFDEEAYAKDVIVDQLGVVGDKWIDGLKVFFEE
ncbi:uncharacterized protein JN550_013411 [Neoarthrinium moseri]|uniref:uncharacterized protein n=1 Tax=Neoarthrinium moseri TaxID=1658444 RepID=UPI001FDCB7BC|nr:uncharacterized protein JN550_013411 [Neoarthrinium moseri]KAI1857228.1 hypothetical protein JN550_013411 [Neoarthrinium moseri]